MEKKIKVLIIDDAAFMRKAVSNILEVDPGLDVVGSGKNGRHGLEQIKKLQPDVITLDIDMPVMDGITAIKHIMIESPVPIVVLSSLSNDGAITFEALRLGVVDFVPKPSGAVSSNIEQSKSEIIDRIKLACAVNQENIRRVKISKDVRGKLSEPYGFYPLEYLLSIGTTLSGPNTVIRLLGKLPPNLPAAVVVVQEISPKILDSFVKEFDKHVPWKVEVAGNDCIIEQGTCYISSNENGLKIDQNVDGAAILKVEDHVDNPLDMLFSSSSAVFSRNAIGVLLTGLGNDGAKGFAKIREASGVTIAQNTECCVYPNLTENAIENDTVDHIIDEKDLSTAIQAVM